MTLICVFLLVHKMSFTGARFAVKLSSLAGTTHLVVGLPGEGGGGGSLLHGPPLRRFRCTCRIKLRSSLPRVLPPPVSSLAALLLLLLLLLLLPLLLVMLLLLLLLLGRQVQLLLCRLEMQVQLALLLVLLPGMVLVRWGWLTFLKPVLHHRPPLSTRPEHRCHRRGPIDASSIPHSGPTHKTSNAIFIRGEDRIQDDVMIGVQHFSNGRSRCMEGGSLAWFRTWPGSGGM